MQSQSPGGLMPRQLRRLSQNLRGTCAEHLRCGGGRWVKQNASPSVALGNVMFWKLKLTYVKKKIRCKVISNQELHCTTAAFTGDVGAQA